MVIITDLLAAAALCLDCLVRQTDLRVDAITPQLDALGAALREGHCTMCAECGPVFSIAA